jgi:hypothetical protein
VAYENSGKCLLGAFAGVTLDAEMAASLGRAFASPQTPVTRFKQVLILLFGRLGFSA